ncbi:hypothetical protein B0O80DRAFT_175184 [Mortierella sp. GBAus27b]|nr:hypothetical protein B0O80DRAFT_175184 [Mortierella sp. GBAus27b]
MLSSKDPMVPQRPQDSQQPAAAIIDSTNPHVNAYPFFWSGPTFSTGYLEPLEEVDVSLTACFTEYGMYDINRWRLSVQVVKAQRKKKVIGSAKTVGNEQSEKDTSREEDEDEEEEQQSMIPPAAPQVIGKGFMQMPNLAHYIQVY